MNDKHTRNLTPAGLAGRRWRGYIRESTQRQADQWSPERQRQDIIRAASDLGMVGGDRWYERVGSGESSSAELELALEDARRREYDVLVVFSTSRFARNREQAVTMKRAFREAGTVIYFVAERLVSGSYASAIHEGVQEVIDEHANQERRMFIAGGQRERHKAGQWLGNIPTGFRMHMTTLPDRRVVWDGTLEEDPEWAPVIRRIFSEYASGVGVSDIVGLLNDTVPAPSGGTWHRNRVDRILRNPVYQGLLVRYRNDAPEHYYSESDPIDGRQVVGQCAPLVEPVLWQKVQGRFMRRSNRLRLAS